MDAAEDLLCDQGSQALTLATVAERAGCSKGGLLYHFGTKEALIKGMVERLIEEFDELVAAQGHDTYTKNYLAATFAAVRSGRLRRWAVVTGASGNLYLLAPLREAMARWHREGARQRARPGGGADRAPGLRGTVGRGEPRPRPLRRRALRDPETAPAGPAARLTDPAARLTAPPA
ncbi:TetR/AcrR family transcriptional regulator [Streptosporangium vulgare]|uniref:TetR/AcrR family transcriptional regulator n=1 Tax=Streptosporangium vulgare TaxID=46190 RepID=UPI003CD08A7B